MTSVHEGPLGIGQLAIPVADLDRALAFYRDVLGLRFLFQAPPGLAFLDCGERGATFVDQPHLIARLPDHELWMVFLRDPDEHLLALMAERRL